MFRKKKKPIFFKDFRVGYKIRTISSESVQFQNDYKPSKCYEHVKYIILQNKLEEQTCELKQICEAYYNKYLYPCKTVQMRMIIWKDLYQQHSIMGLTFCSDLWKQTWCTLKKKKKKLPGCRVFKDRNVTIALFTLLNSAASIFS